MKFKSNFNYAIVSTITITFFLLMFIICAIDVNKIEGWILVVVAVIPYIYPLLLLRSTTLINKKGITIIKSSKHIEFVSWNEIVKYYDSNINRTRTISFTLKNGQEFYIENRKIVKDTIKRYCGDIPDFSDIGKKELKDRYINYLGKFVDLSNSELECINSNTEHCIFCNVKTNKVANNCYLAKEESRKFYICPKCYNDFKKYLRFKTKK